MPPLKEPVHRSRLRLKLGGLYYGSLRKLLWLKQRKLFAKTYQTEPLPYIYFAHRTILRRQLKDVDMWMQENKIINLKIAVKKLNTVILRPGEVFSYWRLIGKPSRRKGYVDGMILHTPLTVVERHRHGYDVFPDSNRTQPFGSGATCFYPHGDLMIQNNTQDTYQLIVSVEDEYLTGEWRVSAAPVCQYKIVERNHEMKQEYWGGYSRHNQLYQQKYDLQGNLLNEQLVVKNSALMMYSPFLEGACKEKNP